jgi:hypothetical protein
MKKFTQGLVLALLFSIGFSAHAQEHVHGQGELLIAQEGSSLQMQFIIPAADALGFEHQATNSSQKKVINVLAQQLKNANKAIDIPRQCILKNTENSLTGYQVDEDHDDKHDHHNIEVTYHFSCETPVNGFSITLFALMPSLNELHVQWINNEGQGSSKVTRNQPVINWKS